MRPRRALACVVLCACVPATDDAEARGAAGFDIVPSAASAGASFATDDGYQITVDRMVMVMTAVTTDSQDYGSLGRVLLGTDRAQVFSRAIPEGPHQVTLGFTGLYLGYEAKELIARVDGWDSIRPDEQERLTRAADSDRSSNYQGPALLLTLHADKGEMHLRMQVALGSVSRISGTGRAAMVDVKRNALAARTADVRPEGLFADSNGTSSFRSFAEADASGDGLIVPAELAAGKITAREAQDAELPSPDRNTMGLLLARMQTGLLVVRP